MTERRHKTERRKENRSVLTDLKERLDEVHRRVYDGLGKEIRDEVKEEISGIRKLVVGLLVSLILALFGIVVTNFVSSGKASSENDRNYRAIMEMGAKFEAHMEGK